MSAPEQNDPTATNDGGSYDDDADTQAAIDADDERAIDDAWRDIEQAGDHTASAQTLAELRNALISIDEACKLTGFDGQAYDLSSLPNFGGEPVDTLSWDYDAVLVRNDDNVCCIRMPGLRGQTPDYCLLGAALK